MATVTTHIAGHVAALVVSSGPDSGAVFRLTDEMVHIGRGADRQVVLSDPDVADLHACIARRNGRYALYALTDAVQLDDSPVPPERWVWLAGNARIRLTAGTVVKFTAEAVAPPEPSDDDSGPPRTAVFKPPRAKPAAGPKSAAVRAGRSHGKKSAVARFITDQQGDTLVKLGEDGQLPELTLAEGRQAKPAEQASTGTNPFLVYGAVAFSFLLSVAMLLLDLTPANVSQRELADARRQIAEFYGRAGEPLRPYQRLLREAQLAHARRDFQVEEWAYRDVLALLNSEDFNRPGDPTRTAALTGDPKRDQRLRQLIATLLRR